MLDCWKEVKVLLPKMDWFGENIYIKYPAGSPKSIEVNIKLTNVGFAISKLNIEYYLVLLMA